MIIRFLVKTFSMLEIILCLVACGTGKNDQNVTFQPLITPELSIQSQTSVVPQKITPSSGIPANTTVEGQYRWLKGIPCYAPCWEGIIPGSTTVTKALEIILNSNSQFIKVEKFVSTTSEVTKGIRWNWVNQTSSSNPNDYGGRLFYDYYSSTQSIVQIRPVYNNITFNLKDVIQTYGEPKYVLAGVSLSADGKFNSYYISFLYPDFGFDVTTSFFLQRPSKPDLSLNMVLKDGVIFFEPGVQNMEKNFKNVVKKVVPWQGIREFDFYCRDSDGLKCQYEF